MPRTSRAAVYAAIDTERAYQDSLWPQRIVIEQGEGLDTEAPNALSLGEFILLMEEYTAKARALWVTTKEPEGAPIILDAVRKVAGIAVNCMEQHGAPKRGDV